MRILFIHQNLPGQFRHLLLHYASRPDCEVFGLGEQRRIQETMPTLPQGLRVAGYDFPYGAPQDGHPYLRQTDAAVARGRQVAYSLMTLRDRGFVPDVVYAHPAWGEALYVKDVFPNAKLICFGEFYYAAEGRDFGFDAEFPDTFEDRLKLRTRNLTQSLSFEQADLVITPTQWQRSCLPTSVQDRTAVVHDGIDTERVRPDAAASVTLAEQGITLTRDDEVITFVNRNLEPYRGFHTFMRALPMLQQSRPNAHIIIVGGDEVSYGKVLEGTTYRQRMLDELQGRLDLSRVHFVGKVPYSTYLSLLQVSTAHVYLTYPFVLSWSMLEAMAAGCAVIGSRTAPVEEVIRDGENGLLVDFFAPDQIAEAVCRVCEHPDRMAAMRAAARATVVRDYDLKAVCLPKVTGLIDQLARASQRVEPLYGAD